MHMYYKSKQAKKWEARNIRCFSGFLKRILIFVQALLCQVRNRAVPVPVFSWQAEIKLVKFAKKTSNILEQNLGKIN